MIRFTARPRLDAVLLVNVAVLLTDADNANAQLVIINSVFATTIDAANVIPLDVARPKAAILLIAADRDRLDAVFLVYVNALDTVVARDNAQVVTTVRENVFTTVAARLRFDVLALVAATFLLTAAPNDNPQDTAKL